MKKPRIKRGENLAEYFEEGLKENVLIGMIRHKELGTIVLWIRNIAVVMAVIIFILSLFLHEQSHMLKGIAYFLGAGAYVSEILVSSDFFTRKLHHREMFMAYCFGPLYVLLGLSYLLGI